MITHTTVRALAQDRLADLHDQARREALVRAARRARHARKRATPRAPGLLAGLTRRARPRGPRRGACDGAHPAPGIRCPGAPGS
jgi:hypothetical protein